MNLPAEFEMRMQKLLGEEYPEFLNCYEEEKKQGLRVNTAKISVEDFLKITPFLLTPIPWITNGFFYQEEDKVTRHPHYYAGLYYIQEPSAMVPASRLPVEPGDKVLDLCAAPGGKATELGARLKGEGLLVANDVSVSRARGLLKNLELFGISNVLVTGETPRQLWKQFGTYFDKILVDAPCSGEGMFRKDPSLIKSWMERGPEYYAPLQKEILSWAVRMLKPGGQILYSTCTFSPEEDEEVIAQILQEFPELCLETAEGYEGFAPGIFQEKGYEGFAPGILREKGCEGLAPESLKGEICENFAKCIRIWPHRMEGEGHFTALMKKVGMDESKENEKRSGKMSGNAVDSARGSGGKGEKKNGNLADTRCKVEDAAKFLKNVDLPWLETGTYFQNKEELFLLPPNLQAPKLRYLRTGLHLGTVKKERFEPSQALAMALTRDAYSNVLDLPAEHPAILRYLKGETLDIPEAESCKSGWVLVCCDGYPLGWGKYVNGTLRNKYQTGWRMQ